jgi:hypothetical protein
MLVVLSLSASALSVSVEAFVLRTTPSRAILNSLATKDEETKTSNLPPDTWSRSPSSSTTTKSGVRNRVRAVLEKAKNRTGRSNFSADEVAGAASIGGLSEETDLVFSEKLASSNGYATQQPYVVPSNETSWVPDSFRGNQARRTKVDVDSMLVDENAVQPLPFQLPKLTKEQKRLLVAGERIQEQSNMGREGSGYVVLDVQAPPYVVWECLLDFESYPEKIGTVRSMTMFTNAHLSSSYLAERPVLPGTGLETRHYGQASISRASFILSKFRLNIAAVHKYQPHPDGHYMEFSLDPACRNLVLKDAKGIWYTESNPDGLGEDVTRVWLLCELQVSPMLPKMIVDYASKRAMPRATSWLKPSVEAKKKQLLE